MITVGVNRLARDLLSGDTSVKALRKGEAIVIPVAPNSSLSKALSTNRNVFNTTDKLLTRMEKPLRAWKPTPAPKQSTSARRPIRDTRVRRPEVNFTPMHEAPKNTVAGQGNNSLGTLAGLALLAVAAAVSIGSGAAKQASEWLTDKVDSAQHWLEEKKESATKWLSDTTTATMSWIGNTSSDVFDKVSTGIDRASDAVSSGFEATKQYVSTAWPKTYNAVATMFELASTVLVKPISWLAEGLPENITTTVNSKVLGFCESVIGMLGRAKDAILGNTAATSSSEAVSNPSTANPPSIRKTMQSWEGTPADQARPSVSSGSKSASAAPVSSDPINLKQDGLYNNWNQSAGKGGPNMATKQAASMAYITSQGMSANGAAGMTGNAQQESSFNPQSSNTSGESSHGMYQWNDAGGGLRWQKAKSWMESKGLDPSDPRAQHSYALQEAKSIRVPGGGNLYDAMKNASTPQEASDLWMNYFERPKERQQNSVIRGGISNQALKSYNNSVVNTPVAVPQEAPSLKSPTGTTNKSEAITDAQPTPTELPKTKAPDAPPVPSVDSDTKSNDTPPSPGRQSRLEHTNSDAGFMIVDVASYA